MTRFTDGFAAVELRCPLCGEQTYVIKAGPGGHRRGCPRCHLVVVMPRNALRRALGTEIVRRARMRPAPVASGAPRV